MQTAELKLAQFVCFMPEGKTIRSGWSYWTEVELASIQEQWHKAGWHVVIEYAASMAEALGIVDPLDAEIILDDVLDATEIG